MNTVNSVKNSAVCGRAAAKEIVKPGSLPFNIVKEQNLANIWSAIPILFVCSSALAGTIRVGTWPTAVSAPIFLAYEKGYFKMEGLDVQLTDTSEVKSFKEMEAKADVAEGQLSARLFRRIIRGSRWRIVADSGASYPGRDFRALVVRKGLVSSGHYKSFSDLRGLKIGTSSYGVPDHILLFEMLKRGNLTPKDVKFVLIPFKNLNAALKTGKIDAAVEAEPYVAEGVVGGYIARVADASDGLIFQESAVLLYSGDFIQRRRFEAVKFMRAYLKGVQLYNKSLTNDDTKKEVNELLSRHIKVNNPEVWNKMVPVGFSDTGEISISSIKAELRAYRLNGLIKRKQSVFRFVDLSFAQQALKK